MNGEQERTYQCTEQVYKEQWYLQLYSKKDLLNRLILSFGVLVVRRLARCFVQSWGRFVDVIVNAPLNIFRQRLAGSSESGLVRT